MTLLNHCSTSFHYWVFCFITGVERAPRFITGDFCERLKPLLITLTTPLCLNSQAPTDRTKILATVPVSIQLVFYHGVNNDSGLDQLYQRQSNEEISFTTVYELICLVMAYHNICTDTTNLV